MHLSIKIGSWGNNELAIYARQPMHPGGRGLLHCVGTAHHLTCEAIADRPRGVHCDDVFSLLLLPMERACTLVIRMRWKLDQHTQELEALTGYAHFRQPWRALPLPVSEIAFGQQLQIYEGKARCLIWACARYEENIAFVQEQLLACRAEIGKGFVDPLVAARHAHNTTAHYDAFAQLKSLIRGHGTIAAVFLARIEAQQTVTRTLIASRDSNTTIEIGKAAKQDSEVMRSIAFLTMVFLPATFLATFFSMVFFTLEDEGSGGTGAKDGLGRLRFDTSVWLYPAVTLPVTVLVFGWYRRRTVRNSESSLVGLGKTAKDAA